MFGKIKLGLDHLFGLWKDTRVRQFTTYHFAIERKGILSGKYYYRMSLFDGWAKGSYPIQ